MKLKEKVALVTGGSRGLLDARGVFDLLLHSAQPNVIVFGK